MGNPAEHSARADAERHGEIVGSDVDVTEHHLIAATAGEDDGGVGAWLSDGEWPVLPSLWGVVDV